MPLPDDRITGNIVDVVAKESGAACTEAPPATAIDNDGDGVINDGCPQAGGTGSDAPEAGADCAAGEALPLDDDGDGLANDGCPGIGPYNPNPTPFWYTTSSGTAAAAPTPACFPQDTAGGNSGTSPRACTNNGSALTAASGVDMIIVAVIPGGGGAIRITDHQNDSSTAPTAYSHDGTVVDLPFPVPVVCRAHTGAAYADGGSDCGVNTTANALSVGSVASSAPPGGTGPGDVSGVVQIGQITVTLPFEGSAVFAVQGIYNP